MLGEATLDMLREEGVDIVMHASPAALARGAGGALELAARDGRRLGPFDCVLWAVGRMAAGEDIELAKAGVALRYPGLQSPPIGTRRAARPGSMPSGT